jgi:hypothetical protein
MADNKKSNAQTVERIKKLQKKLGINDDGVIGPVSLTRLEAVVDEYLILKKGDAKPAPVETPNTPPSSTTSSMIVSKRALDKLIEFEVTSEAAYIKKYQKPIFPGGESGVTIGIGYDVGYNTKTAIDTDWRGKISDADLELLKTAAGVKGAAAGALIAGLKSINVPFAAAREVFYVHTLPRYAKDTRGVYPGIEKLPADAQGALLSLIYNRGTSLTGDRRKEMKEIVALVAARNLAGIADRLTAMKRLWDKDQLPGLHTRRDEEAKLVKNARETYPPQELVKV